MTTPDVTVIDYGMCNLYSVMQALEACGARVKLSSSPHEISTAERLVLPGVGAFQDGMNGLKAQGLVEAIHEFAEKERPLMGICLGMQMLMDRSSEFGNYEGLGLIKGNVIEIPNTARNGDPHKIPYIGWNELFRPDGQTWEGTILNGIEEESAVYFVHSFTCVPKDGNHRLADSYYNGRKISAVIRSGNIYGCQFHPEKSGLVGLDIIRNFLLF